MYRTGATWSVGTSVPGIRPAAEYKPGVAITMRSGVSMVMENTPADSTIRSKTNLHAAPSQPLKPSVTKGRGTARFIPYDFSAPDNGFDFSLRHSS